MRSISRDAWAAGIDHELGFWEHWLSTGGGRWPHDFRRRMDPSTPLELDPRWVELPERGELHVLDVGSGPLTKVGKVAPGLDVQVTAIDPLADEYNRLLDRLGLEPLVRPVRGDAEDLLAAVGDRRFDVVVCHNALDHSYDPVRALQQMVAVTRPSGHVLLYHHENEGEDQDYAGLHAWNFTLEQGRFLIWTPAERIFPDELLQGVSRIDTEQEHPWIGVHLLVDGP